MCVSLCRGVVVCVKCYLSHYSMSWDIGLHSRERIKPHNTHTQHAHTCSHTSTHTQRVFYLGTWAELQRQDSSQNPSAHTNTHFREKRDESFDSSRFHNAQIHNTLPHSHSTHTLSLSPPIQLCALRLQRGWHCCTLHVEGQADVSLKRFYLTRETKIGQKWTNRGPAFTALIPKSPRLPRFSLGQQSVSDSRFHSSVLKSV